MTLDENGTWNLDGDKANGEWGMNDDDYEIDLNQFEDAKKYELKDLAEREGITEEQAEEQLKERIFTT